jgi:hypothetical protein
MSPHGPAIAMFTSDRQEQWHGGRALMAEGLRRRELSWGCPTSEMDDDRFATRACAQKKRPHPTIALEISFPVNGATPPAWLKWE